MEHYAGIDVSLEQSSVCVVDGTGRIVREAKVVSESEALVRFFHRLGVVVTRIGLEAGPLSQWLYAGLRRAGCEVVLLETRQVALSAMVVKTDGVDGPRRHHRAKATAVAQSQGGHPMQISTVGIDLAKRVFQIHGVDQDGNVVLRKQLRRAQVLGFFAKLPPCLVGMEACGTSHHWAREIATLGHEVRLMPPQYVKAYVKRNKHDPADAEACCEAVRRPSMRFVPIKTEEQQAVLIMHRTRELLVRQRTQVVNALRGHLAEFGIIEPQGIWHVGRLRARIEDESTIPEPGRTVLGFLVGQLDQLDQRIAQVGAEILAWHRANPVSQRLARIPGIGPLIASAIVATVPDPSVFRSGREFAAWLGLVPRQHSTGGKERLGRISRQGNRSIRQLLIVGAHSALLRSKEVRANAWVQRLLGRCARLKVAVALANKTARIAWAMMSRGETYRQTVPA
jgi:transposase